MANSPPNLSERDIESLYSYILSATVKGEVTFYFTFEHYVESLRSFKIVMETEPTLWNIFMVPFRDLPLHLNSYQDKQFVGGWDRAVVKWRLGEGK